MFIGGPDARGATYNLSTQAVQYVGISMCEHKKRQRVTVVDFAGNIQPTKKTLKVLAARTDSDRLLKKLAKVDKKVKFTKRKYLKRTKKQVKKPAKISTYFDLDPELHNVEPEPSTHFNEKK